MAILYGPGKYFLCRPCYDLPYDSQRKDKKVVRRLPVLKNGGLIPRLP